MRDIERCFLTQFMVDYFRILCGYFGSKHLGSCAIKSTITTSRCGVLHGQMVITGCSVVLSVNHKHCC